MKNHFTLLFGLFLVIFLSCNSDPINLTSDEVFAIRTLDVGSNENASDILVNFRVNNPTTIKELRAFIISPEDWPTFTSGQLNDLSTSSYFSINNIGEENQLNLGAELKDVDGADIVADKDYFIGFGVLIDDDVLLNTSIGDAKLSTEHFLTGEYNGTWNDNLYTNFGISAELKFSGTTLSGPFYYSNNQISCCGGDNDGSISMTLEDNQISTFRYNQQLESFMGGQCNGTYNGSGTIENFTELVISFEGDDCEGPHTGGEIRLRKI